MSDMLIPDNAGEPASPSTSAEDLSRKAAEWLRARGWGDVLRRQMDAIEIGARIISDAIGLPSLCAALERVKDLEQIRETLHETCAEYERRLSKSEPRVVALGRELAQARRIGSAASRLRQTAGRSAGSVRGAGSRPLRPPSKGWRRSGTRRRRPYRARTANVPGQLERKQALDQQRIAKHALADQSESNVPVPKPRSSR